MPNIIIILKSVIMKLDVVTIVAFVIEVVAVAMLIK